MYANESVVTGDVRHEIYLAKKVEGINHETLTNIGMCFCGACSFKLNDLSERSRNELV